MIGRATTRERTNDQIRGDEPLRSSVVAMGLSRLGAKKIEQLKASMPTEPIRDGVVSQAGRHRMEIAEVYLREGDPDAAADWYLRAAEYSRDSGDVLGAVAYVKRGIKLSPSRKDLRALYERLWEVLGIGGEPDPVE